MKMKFFRRAPASQRGSGPLRLPCASRVAGAPFLPAACPAVSSAAFFARSSAPHLPPQMDHPASACAAAMHYS